MPRARILTYSSLQVTIIQATAKPAEMVKRAVGLTMHKDIAPIDRPASSNLCRFLLEAEHTSVFEHVVYTFLIENVSRSFLAQITRQRMCSFTCASQHYQDYRDYPCVVGARLSQKSIDVIADTYTAYENEISVGHPKEEARQLLPNAAAVNILWTINARSLATFLRQRLCNRNVYEMRNFAELILSLVKAHFPQLFDHVGPQCFLSSCKQGDFQCAQGSWM